MTSELSEADGVVWRAPVGDKVVAPSSREPSLLPFHERSWQDFERCILVIAEHVDGLHGVRLYGVPGQAQKGIDLYGINSGGEVIAYQPKRLQSLTSTDLEAAVSKFDHEDRAVGATELVVCVSCDADDTKIAETLERLRSEHSDFAIQLYDRRSLSEKVKNRPDVVRRLFGQAWASAFCDGEDWAVPEPVASALLADALVRGPVVAMGLGDALTASNTRADSDPGGAAESLTPIIDALVAGGYEAFADALLTKRAEHYVKADRIDLAAVDLSHLAWRQVEAGGPDQDQRPLRRLGDLAREHGLDRELAYVKYLSGVGKWYAHPRPDLPELLKQTLELAALGHFLAPEAVHWLAMTAVASRDLAVGRGLLDLIDDQIRHREKTGLVDEMTVCLRTARADLSGEWDDLRRDARAGRLGGRLATLVHTRFGRYAFLAAQLEDAEAEFSAAISYACTAGLTSEAAACVRSVATVRTRSGELPENVNDVLRLASHLEASGGVGLVGNRDPNGAAAASLARGKLLRALRWYRTALRTSVFRGDLGSETDALLGLAVVLRQSGERAAAVPLAIAAASTAEVKECLPLNFYVDFDASMASGPFWTRATALEATSLQADLVPDVAVSRQIDIALAAAQEPRRSIFGPHVYLAGWKAVAALAERTTLEQAALALDLLEGGIDREANHYRYEDDQHVQIVAGIASSHEGLAERTSAHLIRILEQGDEFADSARRAIVRRLGPPPTALLAGLVALADRGDLAGLRTLGDLGIAHPDLVADVSAAVASALAAPAPSPGVISFGTTLPSTAKRARILDEPVRIEFAQHCMSFALDLRHLEINRTDAAEAISILARSLPNDVRAYLFDLVLALAGDPDPTGPADEVLEGGSHPLSTVRLDLGRGSLPRQALVTAAALAVTPEHTDAVVALGLGRLLSRDEDDCHAAAVAISDLDLEHIDLDPRPLSTHPSIWGRNLAAVLAVHRDPVDEAVIRLLAVDAQPEVRRTVAHGLDTLDERATDLSSQIRAVLQADNHWSVRRASGAD